MDHLDAGTLMAVAVVSPVVGLYVAGQLFTAGGLRSFLAGAAAAVPTSAVAGFALTALGLRIAPCVLAMLVVAMVTQGAVPILLGLARERREPRQHGSGNVSGR